MDPSHAAAVAPFGCVLAVQSDCTLCVGHSPVMDNCLRSAILWKLMLKYLSNIGILLKLEEKCTYMFVLGHKHTQGHQRHYLICSVFLFDQSFLVWALALSGYATLFKANNWEAFGLLNHPSHFKDMCCADVWDCFDFKEAETCSDYVLHKEWDSYVCIILVEC